MTTLVVQTLANELVQEIRLSSQERYSIGAIYPYLYLHNSPAGTFTLEIKSGSTVVASKSFTSAEIKAALPTTDDYLHTFHPVIFSNPVQLDKGTYSVRLSASGYSPGSSFMGWIQQHEDLNNQLDYTPIGDDQNPLALRLKVYRSY